MKKLNDRQIRWIFIVSFLLAPFFLAYFGLALGSEWIGRLIGLTILIIGFPVIFLWLAVNPKYKNDFGATINGKRYTTPGRILGLLLVALLSLYCKNFVFDLFDVIKTGAPSKEGYVVRTQHTPYTFFVRGQSIVLEGQSKDEFSSLFSPYLAHTGDSVNIRYLPRTKLIIEIRRESE